MGNNYNSQFNMIKLVSAAQLGVALVLIIITELMLKGIITQPEQVLSGTGTAGTIHTVFTVVGFVLLVLAFFIKRTIRTMKEGPVMAFLQFQLKMIKQQGNSSAMALLLPPSALCELVVILGFILFILTKGSREIYYPFYLAGLAMMTYIFPTEDEKQNLIRMDNNQN